MYGDYLRSESCTSLLKLMLVLREENNVPSNKVTLLKLPVIAVCPFQALVDHWGSYALLNN